MVVKIAGIGTTMVQWDALRAIDTNPRSSAHAPVQATFQSDQSFGTLADRPIAADVLGTSFTKLSEEEPATLLALLQRALSGDSAQVSELAL